MSQEATTTPAPAPNNLTSSLTNIAFNIVIPILVLNKLSLKIGATQALILALAFPLTYGLHDYIKNKKLNYISLLGLLNVLFTGGLALLNVSGIWYAVKEATFPTLIGLFVLGSAFTKKPFIKMIFMNPQLMKLELLDEKLKERNTTEEFQLLLKNSTLLLSGTFAISAFLNYFVARYTFTSIDATLSAEERALLLNDQIAANTAWSNIIITGTSMICLMAILWFLLRGIKKLSGLKLDQIMREG